MNWALLLTWQLVWAQTKQGVYHERSASWFKVESIVPTSDAYFGYSITYEPTSKRLIVSAPQRDNIGEIYSCDLSATENQCTSFKKDPFRFDPTYDHNYWLGATVKAGPSYFVTCAPLNVLRQSYKYKNGSLSTPTVGTFSRCYKYTTLSENATNLQTMNIEERSKHGWLFEHTMDSFGWSIDIDDNDVIIGGPAMYTGRVLKYDAQSKETTAIIDGLASEEQTDNIRRVDYNFGYSVAVGYFTEGGEKKSYAIGSPYGIKGTGKIVFYTFTLGKAHHNFYPYFVKEDLQSDDQFAVGSMFGAVVCAARLQGGRTTTLIVGAPAYAPPQQYNQGAVYFYAPEKRLPLKKAFRKIVGEKDGGFFGSAIAALGDYNGDGLDEIAIAAPFEDSGAGVVYIYSGAHIVRENGEMTWIQRIVATDPTRLVRSFGLSLSAIQDYDENGCNELAIGAPESNEVMVLKCFASVKVTLQAVIPELSLLNGSNPFRTQEHFIFQSCLKAEFPEKPDVIYAHIVVEVHVIHPNVTLVATDKKYDVYLNREEESQCRDITVLAPLNGNYQQAIRVDIKAYQGNHPELQTEFNASHVLLNDRSDLTASGLIYLSECKDKEHCKPELKLNKTLSVTEPYVIGSPEDIKLAMTVRNDGEVAYEACVRVFPMTRDEDLGVRAFPMTGDEDLGVIGVPRGCERLPEHFGALICRPADALIKDHWKVSEITFDSSRLTSKHKLISILITLYNDCNQNIPAWQETEKIPLQTDLSKTFIRGITDTGVSNTVNVSKDDVDGKAFEHSYTISNGGLTNLVDIEVTLVRQNRSYIEYGSIFMASSYNTENIECLPSPDNATIFTCVIDKLNSKQSAKITVPMKIISLDSLEIAIRDKENTQFTSALLKVNEVELPISSVTSTFKLGGKIKVWIIVVAALVGLLILLLFFFLLSRCGFFKRKKKNELENVRKSVRRQTIMRRTMMDGVRVPRTDSHRQSLLASVAQESAEEAAARDKRVRLDSNATRNKVEKQ